MKYPLPGNETLLQIQLFLQRHARPEATAGARLHSNGVATDGSGKQRADSAHPLRAGSWLALSPFLLLVAVGVARWYFSRRSNRWKPGARTTPASPINSTGG